MNGKKYKQLIEAYQNVYEQIRTDNPDKTLQKIIDSDPKKYGGGKVVPLTPTKSANVQKAHYEPDGELIEEVDIYDEILNYLLSEGYSEKESNRIMVELVNENFWKAVQQRTGIGKPGVGPGQVAKNILRAGITDILGTSIATGSTPSSVGATKTSPSIASSPTPVVKTSTKVPRTAPKGANITPDPWKGGATGNRIQNITQKPSAKPTITRALPGSSVRGLLSPGVKNVLPDPWKQASDTVSGSKNLWSKVQKVVKSQPQLKPAQTNVRGLLPASKPTGSVDKLPPKPAQQVKPAVKPKVPGGGSKVLQGLGTLASLRNLTPFGVAAAVTAPRPTADGTLTAARSRGDLNKGATNWVDPMPTPKILKRSGVDQKPAVKSTPTKSVAKSVPQKSVAKPASTKSDKPRDPDVQKYNELRKSDPIKAKELGMKIWARKYRPAMEPPDIA